MGLFTKTKRAAGWLAISLQEEGICAAHVVRAAASRPVVELIAFLPHAQPKSVAALEKAARDCRADSFHCSTLLAPGEYQILSLEAPNVPPEELKTAMRWRLKDMLDYHVDDATIDVIDIPADKHAPARSRSMFAVAAHNQTIRQRQESFAQAKIPLSVIDIPEMAQRNVAALLEAEGRGLAMLSFDADGGLLTVTHGGELYVSRHIDIPLAALEQADEAPRQESYDRITLELQRSLDHFERQFHTIALSKLMLAPMGSAGVGLQQYLSSNLYLPVEAFDLETVLDLSKVPDLRQPATQQRFFLTLGAALRQEEKAL
jgi:MSHA biogenesis protein MshI